MSNANDEFTASDSYTDETPQGGDTVDNDYASSRGDTSIPVVKDDAEIEQPRGDPDSDEMLKRDDTDAIDESNIIGGDRTRGAKPEGGYKEPGDDEGLPGPEDGTSSVN